MHIRRGRNGYRSEVSISTPPIPFISHALSPNWCFPPDLYCKLGLLNRISMTSDG